MGRTSIERYTNKIAKGLVGLLLVIAVPGQAEEEVLLDRLVAEVNGDPITHSEVQQKVDKNVLVEVSAYPASEQDSTFDIALQDAINLKLILQKAEELEINVDDEQLESEIDKFIKRRGLTKDSLMSALKQEGISYEDYKKDWHKQMVISQFQGREIMPAVKITDRDVEIFYLQESGASGETVKVTLRQLFIGVPESKREAKLAKLNKVVDELKNGLPFTEAVEKYSENMASRKNGGLMPGVMLKDLAEVIRPKVSPLGEGDVTDPVKVGSGYYLFYLEKKEFTGSEQFQKAKPQLEQRLRQEQVVDQTIKWLASERRRSEIRVVPK